jgi:glyoxylase-like metal-dependent hydrolase (beta-lactamase superfamily II)
MKQKRWGRRIFFWFSVLVLIALAVGVIWLRSSRDKHEAAVAVTANTARIRNLFVDFYAARAGAHVILFDAGVDRGGSVADALLAQLQAKREDVSDVFITHGHGDHISAVPLFTNAKVHASSKDVDMMRDRSLVEPFMAIVFGWILPPPYATAVVTDAGEVVVDKDKDLKVRVFDLPGHTGGSMAYLYDGVLYTGDSIGLREGKLTPAPPMVSVDREQNKKSIKELEKSLAGAKVDFVCTGHDGCTAAGQAPQLLKDLFASVGG